MRGYRLGTRVFGLLCLSVPAFVAVLTGMDTREGWDAVPAFLTATLAFVILRFTCRPRLWLAEGVLLVEEPLWRWALPRAAVMAVQRDAGRLCIRSREHRIEPFAFSPSLLAQWLGDSQQRQAYRVLRRWLEEWPEVDEAVGVDRPRRGFRPVWQDAIVCLAVMHLLYGTGRLAEHWGWGLN